MISSGAGNLKEVTFEMEDRLFIFDVIYTSL